MQSPTHISVGRHQQMKRLMHMATSTPILLAFGLLLASGSIWTMGRYVSSLDGVTDAQGQLVAGDFLAFYTGGTIVGSGHGPALYDLSYQHDIEHTLIGVPDSPWQPYVNPPLLALALSWVNGVPFATAMRLFCAAMCAAAAGSLVLAGRSLPALRGDRMRWLAVCLLVLSFHPIARTMLGGQNTPLTLVLLTGVFAGLHHRHSALAGVCLGLLSYKPQFALFIGLVVLGQQRWRVAVWAIAIGLAHYVVAGVVCGFDWPWAMLDALAIYQPLEAASSYYTHIAILPVCNHSLPAPWNHLVAATAITAVIGLFVVAVLRARHSDKLVFGAAVCVTMLISPHLQFYDVGVLVLPVLIGLDDLCARGQQPSESLRGLLCAGYLAFPIYAFSHMLGFQPLILWPLGVFLWLCHRLWTAGQPSVIPASNPSIDHCERVPG